jgi:hypothetical protein
MGWLKKKFRQLDKRIRKIFGGKGWAKVAALVATFYMGYTGNWGAGGTSVAKRAAGTSKFGQFFGNLGRGVKNMFWTPAGTTTSTTTSTVGGKTTIGTTTTPTKGGLNWAGQAVAQTGLSVAAGYGQAKLMEGDPVGQYVSAGSNEPSTIDIVQNAYNRAGKRINILDVYNDLDYGSASTQMADNFLQPAGRGFINIPS